MQQKPVFVAEERFPYFYTVLVPFETPKVTPETKNIRKNRVQSLHERFGHIYPDKKVLEVSGTSKDELGRKIRSEILEKKISSLDITVPVSNVYRGSCVFEKGGPYPELYELSPQRAKSDRRLKEKGSLLYYYHEEAEYPKRPRAAFYSWIYINALLENRELAEQVIKYDAFSDINCSPGKKPFGAARGAAIFTALSRMKLLDSVKEFESFRRLVSMEVQGRKK